MRLSFAPIALLASLSHASFAEAREVVLRAVSAWTEGTEFSRNFERFIDKVNADGKGEIQIRYIGGPRAIPTFEIGNAVRSRVVDIANSTGAYYANIMPEADSIKLLSLPMSVQRSNGTWDYLNHLHNQRLNSWYLARQFHNVKYHLYLNKKIHGLNLQGLKIRVTPIYRDIVESMGGVPITTSPNDIYTALERGVVDGFGWPITGIFDLGVQKVTKYRLEPGFYSADANVLVNLDAWKELSDTQRRILNEAAHWLEALDFDKVADIRREREQQTNAGIEPLTLSSENEKTFLTLAKESAWKSIVKRAPETGPQLQALSEKE